MRSSFKRYNDYLYTNYCNSDKIEDMSEINDEKSMLRWRKRNKYYYAWLDKLYKFVVRPNSKVLHLGCECGDLLATVKPCYGVGIDTDQEAIKLAKKRFGHLEFHTVDPHELNIDGEFDYVLISNSLGKWHDIQQVLERIGSLTNENTRIVITYYNYLWEWILRLGSLLKIRRPQPYQNWLPSEDISNLLYISGFDVIRTDSSLLLPKRIPLFSAFFNYVLALVPILRCLNLVNLVIARRATTPKKDEDLSVSVIVPCRNEKG